MAKSPRGPVSPTNQPDAVQSDKDAKREAQDRTVQGGETRVDEKSGRVLGPDEETLEEQHPEIEPAPEADDDHSEDARGQGGDVTAKDGASDAQVPATDTTSTDSGSASEIKPGMSAEDINPGSVSSVSTPNTVVTLSGERTGSTTVPAGTTVYQALASLGVADASNYKISGPNGTLKLEDTINEDTEITLAR